MNYNNLNLVEEEHESFWKKTLIGIPYWLLALVLLILILYWAYKQEYLSSLGFSSTPKNTVAFAQRDVLTMPTISPVEGRLNIDNYKAQ